MVEMGYNFNVVNMEKKQTAVEWLFLMMNNPNKDQEFANKLLNKAKEMEKEQIIEAFENGEVCTMFKNEGTSRQYYNKTYQNTDK